ncbi:MAG TPA: YIP1 family protein [Gaiellaceae bacterium]|nr:YIP1 family protein [Gaiellaceae bacterium]
MSAHIEQETEAREREWWARLPRLLYAPAGVFAEVRDESREAADARQEPLVAVTFLAGIAMFIGLVALEPPFKSTDIDFSTFNLALETILGGALVALSNFWLGGTLVYLGARGLGAFSGYRLARHIAGFATAPFILLLVTTVPVRLALYGTDVFKAEGRDSGAGGDVFIAIDAVMLVWTLALVLIGLRTTQQWSWGRAAAALGVALLFAILLGTLTFASSR